MQPNGRHYDLRHMRPRIATEEFRRGPTDLGITDRLEDVMNVSRPPCVWHGKFFAVALFARIRRDRLLGLGGQLAVGAELEALSLREALAGRTARLAVRAGP
jgi:hypothetical protein